MDPANDIVHAFSARDRLHAISGHYILAQLHQRYRHIITSGSFLILCAAAHNIADFGVRRHIQDKRKDAAHSSTAPFLSANISIKRGQQTKKHSAPF
jgi:hypothetical protein